MVFYNAEQLFLDTSKGPLAVTSETSLISPHPLFYSELQLSSLELFQISLTCAQVDHLNRKDQMILLSSRMLQHVCYHLARSWKLQ
jgi:hypothetical protein